MKKYLSFMLFIIYHNEKANNNYLISKNLIDIISKNESWQDLIGKIPNEMLDLFKTTNIENEIITKSTDSLNPIMTELEHTKDCVIGLPHFELNLTDENITKFIKNSTVARYKFNDYTFEEHTQGLGISNLIYMHIQLEKFKKEFDKTSDQGVRVRVEVTKINEKKFAMCSEYL